MALGLDVPSAVMISAMQPVRDVRAYLDSRKPVADPENEQPLFMTLPNDPACPVRSDVRALFAACQSAKRLVAGGISVTKACAQAYHLHHSRLSVSLSSFRNTYFDPWSKKGDWTILVNRTKAGAAWQDRDESLPSAFLDACATLFGSFSRKDAKHQAVLALHRWWKTGLYIDDVRRPVPGYGFWQDWVANKSPGQPFAEAPIPQGWSYDNVLRQIKARAKFTKAVRALLHEGTAAAKEHLPHHLRTRKNLRFLELVTFDDVRVDWLIFDPKSGQPCELWLLVARDQATSMVLGFVMHPAVVRADGSQSHLGLREMKQLAAWLLERYPLPADYICHWLVERGTATLPEPVANALAEMLPNRIKLHYTSMLGRRSPSGYEEKRKGNSRGKASHESHNRLFHTQGSYIPGQTGSHYGIRPADLQARCDEAVEIWETAKLLPEHLRNQMQYPVLLIEQARNSLFKICTDQNFRTEHELEAFERVLEWFNPREGRWMPQNTYDGTANAQFRTRKEMPVERAVKLIRGHNWVKASPEVIITLLSHTIKHVPVKESGEITFRHEGSTYVFAPPTIDLPSLASLLPLNRKALAYFHPDDPQFLHVTNGKGSVLGTWFQRGRVGYMEEPELLAQAMRYTDTALKTVQACAERIAAPERQRLDDMRQDNAEVLANAACIERGNEFNQIATLDEVGTHASPISSPTAAALESVSAERETTRAQTQRAAAAAAEDILAPAPASTGDTAADPDAFLSAISHNNNNNEENQQ